MEIVFYGGVAFRAVCSCSLVVDDGDDATTPQKGFLQNVSGDK